MVTSNAGRVAALLVGLEGVGLLALAGWQVVALVTGDTAIIETALALIVLTVVCGAALLAFAYAIGRGHSWGRSGGIVAQVLILAIALGAATGSYAHPLTALAIAAPAVLTLVLLIVAVRSAGRAASAAEKSAGSETD